VQFVSLNDSVPAYTNYGSSQPATQCAATGGSANPVFAQSGLAVACNAPVSGLTLNPQGTVTLFYQVKVQN
jgi:hypothetical protein